MNFLNSELKKNTCMPHCPTYKYIEKTQQIQNKTSDRLFAALQSRSNGEIFLPIAGFRDSMNNAIINLLSLIIVSAK